jgi:hypothetical protein
MIPRMIPLINHDSSEGGQWVVIICPDKLIYIYIMYNDIYIYAPKIAKLVYNYNN